MRISSGSNEDGFALIGALALMAILSMVVASAVTLSQYLAAEIDTFASRARSRYAAESVLHRTLLALENDRAKYPDRNLTPQNTAELDCRFMADGRIHNMEVDDVAMKVQIFDAMTGLDLSGPNPARQLLYTTQDTARRELLERMANRLNDYADNDSLVRKDGMEKLQYQMQNIPHLPRNDPLQFREEARWVPELRNEYPDLTDGRWDCFRVIAPERMRTLAGRPNLYATPVALLAERCRLNRQEAALLQTSLRQWQEAGIPLQESLPPSVWSKLSSYFSTMESGLYTIRIKGANPEYPAATLSATIQLNSYSPKLEFYEFTSF